MSSTTATFKPTVTAAPNSLLRELFQATPLSILIRALQTTAR